MDFDGPNIFYKFYKIFTSTDTYKPKYKKHTLPTLHEFEIMFSSKHQWDMHPRSTIKYSSDSTTIEQLFMNVFSLDFCLNC